jgi:hypothetical protein
VISYRTTGPAPEKQRQKIGGKYLIERDHSPVELRVQVFQTQQDFVQGSLGSPVVVVRQLEKQKQLLWLPLHQPRVSATITNKKDLEEYFTSGLKKFPMLHFIPMDYFLKNHKLIFEYNATPDNKIQWSVIEKFEFNNDGLIEKSSVYYGAEDIIANFLCT